METATVEAKVTQNKFFTFFFLLVVLYGCTTDRKNFEKGWSSRDEYFFDYTSLNDTLPSALLFHVVPDKSYKYKNFSFELLVIDPHFKMYKDTISVMFDTTSVYRKGASHIIMSNLLMQEGHYRFRVKEVMCDTLFGIKDFNLRIIPKWGKIK